MKINFAHHSLYLCSSGIVFWPDRSLAIVTDLHLEKGSHYAQRGFFLPPYDSFETLQRLHTCLKDLGAHNILILGDTFHDAAGHSRLPVQARQLFDRLIDFNPIWITGNHDGDFVPSGFVAYDSLIIDGITFNHEAVIGTPYEISGHYHPKVDIFFKEARITRPCFIEDGNKLIIPAFGAYTGGLSTTHPFINRHFKNPRIYALGEKIYRLQN